MGISRENLITLKAKVKAEMKRRNGLGPASGKKWTPQSACGGSLEMYSGAAYDFTHTPAKDAKIYPEYGQKTIDLLLKIAPKDGLYATKDGEPIPPGFQNSLIDYVDRLSAEPFTGETASTIAAKVAVGEIAAGSIQPESTSCQAACTGLCTGSCISMCNGCLGTCTATCGTGCAGGLMVSSY